MTTLHALRQQGQSIWYDYISRDYIASGAMARHIELGVLGMTSNPTIFEKAVAGSASYDAQIAGLDATGATTAEIARALFVEDVRSACDVMLPTFQACNGGDGFISLEVSPTLADDTAGTIEEAHALWRAVDRPNLMIKIPATPEGIPAIRQAIVDGLSVNITLIFSREQYRQVAEAYIEGLEERKRRGHPINNVASVASVFISRIDTLIDARLTSIETMAALEMRGKAAVANAKLIYQDFLRLFSGERWETLAADGARVQRPLWASTSTKNPDYPDLLYVTSLIGPDTVNTVPPETLEAILDHGVAEQGVTEGAAEAEGVLATISGHGVDLDDAMATLLAEGVSKFADSFATLFAALDAKRASVGTDTD